MSEELQVRDHREDHQTLVAVADAMDAVTTAMTRPPVQSQRGEPETTLLLDDAHDRIPPDLLREIAACDLGVWSVHHEDSHLIVEVR